MFQIVDDNGVMHEGTEQDMQRAFFILTWNEKSLHQLYSEKQLTEYKQSYRTRPTKGKVRMISKEMQQAA